MLQASAAQDFRGYTLVVDASGILGVPFETSEHGETGYYAEFQRRAYGPIKLKQVILDVITITREFGGIKTCIFLSALVILFSSLGVSILNKFSP